MLRDALPGEVRILDVLSRAWFRSRTRFRSESDHQGGPNASLLTTHRRARTLRAPLQASSEGAQMVSSQSIWEMSDE